MSDALKGVIEGVGGLGAAYLPYALSQDQIDLLNQMGPQYQQQAQDIAQQASEAAAFTPYAVDFGTSRTTVGPQGDVTSQLDPALAAIQGGMFQQAQGLINQQGPTAESLYGQISAMRQPEIDRQRQQLEARLAAQGRLGTQTSMFGGTPEALAMEKALAEQQSADLFQATQLAPQLEAQRVANITGMLGAGFIPQQQSLAALQPSIDLARIGQAARQGQSEALFKGGIAGLEAQAASQTAAANVEAARTQALSNALQGLFAQPDYKGGQSVASSVLEQIFG